MGLRSGHGLGLRSGHTLGHRLEFTSGHRSGHGLGLRSGHRLALGLELRPGLWLVHRLGLWLGHRLGGWLGHGLRHRLGHRLLHSIRKKTRRGLKLGVGLGLPVESRVWPVVACPPIALRSRGVVSGSWLTILRARSKALDRGLRAQGKGRGPVAVKARVGGSVDPRRCTTRLLGACPHRPPSFGARPPSFGR